MKRETFVLTVVLVLFMSAIFYLAEKRPDLLEIMTVRAVGGYPVVMVKP